MLCYPYSERVCPSADSEAKPYGDESATCSMGIVLDFYDTLTRPIVNAFVIHILNVYEVEILTP
jgi:hypothetical protein